MSYKNPKINKSFESYDNGERSHMVSGDALAAMGDSHRKFDNAMEAGKQLGANIAKGVDKYQAKEKAKKETETAIKTEVKTETPLKKKMLDEGAGEKIMKA